MFRAAFHFTTDQEVQKEQERAAASSFNAPIASREDKFFGSTEVLNAIDEFEKIVHKARDVKDKIIPSFDLGVDNEVQTKEGPASALHLTSITCAWSRKLMALYKTHWTS